jgi:hypothetical protein
MLVEVVILDFKPMGTLEFFALQPEGDYQRGLPVSYLGNIYWRDAQSPQGFGPFNNLYDALNHHKAMHKLNSEKPKSQVSLLELTQTLQVQLNEPEQNNLIEYDFRKKKYVK